MRVLVACEFSGIVRDAFIKKGHAAMSCDLLPSESLLGPHYQGSISDLLKSRRFGKWDLMIAHPPCTYLASSGARWWKKRKREQELAHRFVVYLWAQRQFMKVAIENPIGYLSNNFGKPDQIIQPWQFGHGETKATCLWLAGLPKLMPTKIVKGREARIHRMSPSPNRQKERSRTYQGIADAMADQWGKEPKP